MRTPQPESPRHHSLCPKCQEIRRERSLWAAGTSVAVRGQIFRRWSCRVLLPDSPQHAPASLRALLCIKMDSNHSACHKAQLLALASTPGPHLPSCVHTGIPVSGAFLETQPQGGQAVEGKVLVFICSVAEGTGETTFSWHRADTGESLGSKSQRSRRSELTIPEVRENHAGGYYCSAENTQSPIQSEVVNITVKSKYHSHSQPAASSGSQFPCVAVRMSLGRPGTGPGRG